MVQKMAVQNEIELLDIHVNQLSDDIRKNPKLTLANWANDLERNQYIRILDANNRIIFERGINFPIEWIMESEDTDAASGIRHSEYFQNGQHLIFSRKTIRTNGLVQPGMTVQLFENTAKVDQFVNIIGKLLITSALGGICAAAIVSYLVARASIRPVGVMIHHIKQMDMNDLHQRIPLPHSKDEIRDMAVTLNGMLERLDTGFEAQRQFVADASHELRTPLTIIEGHTNLMKRWGKNAPEVVEESTGYILLETSRLRHLTDQLLQTDSIDNSSQWINEQTDLMETVKELCHQAAFLNPKVHLQASLGNDAIPLRIPKSELQQAVLNVLDNAMKYTPDGGEVVVTLQHEETNVSLIVADTGIGISEQDLPHLYERFYRADKSRSRERGGSGLGLSITKKIIDRYGGSIQFESALGVGTRVIVRFPFLHALVIFILYNQLILL
jgi:two-component system sensor histidine kinase ArlS